VKAGFLGESFQYPCQAWGTIITPGWLCQTWEYASHQENNHSGIVHEGQVLDGAVWGIDKLNRSLVSSHHLSRHNRWIWQRAISAFFEWPKGDCNTKSFMMAQPRETTRTVVGTVHGSNFPINTNNDENKISLPIRTMDR